MHQSGKAERVLRNPAFGSDAVQMRLPWPPSVNTLWRNVVIGRAPRTLLSEKGREYFVEAACAVYAQREGRHIAGRAFIEITLMPPDRRVSDIDNRCKAILDSCTKGGLWADDSQVDVLVVERGEITKGGAVLVRAVELQGLA